LTGALLEAEGLGHSFGELQALEALDLAAAEYDVLGIVGPSGCGKTTLLELIAGLREPSRGRVRVSGAEAPEARLQSCAYMPQRDLLLPWLAAIDNASIALRNSGASRSEARAAALPLFDHLGLAGFEAAAPAALSGGMRQRVAFLRTLLAGKPVLLLDEPFGALDAITRAEMQEWLRKALAEEPRTTILVTHDVEEALYVCNRVLVLSPRPGRVVADFQAADLTGASRTEVVTAPEFVTRRERALVALGSES
jgi:NitT/TauT family transport system ATP-binding protein